MQTTIQQIEARRHQEAVESYMSRHFDHAWLDEVERRAFEKHALRRAARFAAVKPEPPAPHVETPPSPFINGQPVSHDLTKLAVDIAKQELQKRQPKRSRKILP